MNFVNGISISKMLRVTLCLVSILYTKCPDIFNFLCIHCSYNILYHCTLIPCVLSPGISVLGFILEVTAGYIEIMNFVEIPPSCVPFECFKYFFVLLFFKFLAFALSKIKIYSLFYTCIISQRCYRQLYFHFSRRHSQFHPENPNWKLRNCDDSRLEKIWFLP